MADNNPAAADSQRLNTGDALSVVVEECNHGDLDFAGRTSQHRTQDIYQLLDTFIREARKVLPCDGIEFREEALGLYHLDGVLSHHRCGYKIRLGEQSLGEIAFSRETEFHNDERVTIENLVAGLGMPLRNALHYQRAVQHALRDSLTGLRNGNAFQDTIAQEVERAQRYKIPFSLLLINLDDFGDINQRYGQAAGNALLIEVAARLEKEARNSDILYRKGGDEFLLFLPNTAKTAALRVAERMKYSVLSGPCLFENREIRYTTSIGVVSVQPDDSPHTIVDRADKALYHAKILGKDRIQAGLGPENLFQE